MSEMTNNDKLPSELLGNKVQNSVTGRASVMGELLSFLWQRKLYWLIPMVIVLLVFGLIIIASGSSIFAPFIYTLGV
jgi:hypothetical protein